MTRPLAFAVKLGFFNLSLLMAYGLTAALGLPIVLNTAIYLSVGFFELTYLLYDLVLTRLITLYVYRFREKLRVGRFFK